MAKLYTRKSDGTYVPNNPQSVTNIDVVQATGDSVTATMSQDAVTKELATKQDILTTGNGISIEGNMIGVTSITESDSQPNTSLWINPSEDEETDVTYNRSQIDAMLGAKQDALQLTVKDNGNIVLSNIQGQSKEFMPATPSGDPMHYAYEAAGAEWNGTGADIIKTAPWADLADDDADKTVVHKAGYWYLNGLGDITNEQMRRIYMLTASNQNNWSDYCCGQNLRTNILTINDQIESAKNLIYISANVLRRSTIEVLIIPYQNNPSYRNNIPCFNLSYIEKLKYVIGIFTSPTSTYNNTYLYMLKGIKISLLSKSMIFGYASNLSLKSILFMIENEAATSAITITLHADAYARAMANADIVAALEAHPNVSLASA